MVDRTIVYDYISRVEGQGSLEVTISNGEVKDAKLQIFEAPRFFEAFLRGRRALELPELTSRICGICPIAHAITAAKAVENALEISLDERTVALRKALALSGMMQSHALHIYFLAAPDYLGYPSAIAASKDLLDVVKRGFRLKRIANMVSEYIGGRVVHPVTLTVGGFTRSPPAEKLDEIIKALDSSLQDAFETISLVSNFKYPEFESDHINIALSNKGEYAVTEGVAKTSSGEYFDGRDYRKYVNEEQVPYSNTKRSIFRGGSSFEVGPVARFNLNYDFLCDTAKEAAEKSGVRPPLKNPFKSTIIRAIEIIQAIEEMKSILKEGVNVPPPQKPKLRQGMGAALTEAPRGLLYHSYILDKEGRVSKADIVTPTAHNSWRIERDVYELVPSIAHLDDNSLRSLLGMLVRSYDPCISCSVHAFTVRLIRE
ncbi:MAG: Ni/Fe hydrogenase subunit alpha [Thermoproteota archaeon]|nr:Ni/Fe hydrogenase subunit alpha [Candidatus Brockarchaeota archaeon]MBO3840440.1 Ni/Fe hydrogenase subunit alpha [Candidatus Brockarchaeota archaeon]